jgi:transposase
MESVIERLKRGVAAASEATSEDPESSSCSKRSSQTHRDVSGFERCVRSPEDVASAMPAAWQKSISAEKRKEDEELKELFETFDDFDRDLIQQLLEQEEDIKVVRNALYKLRNNAERSDKRKPARGASTVQTEKSPVRRSKRIRLCH